MIKSIIIHIILSIATIHSGPFSLPSATYLHHGHATEVVTISDRAIDCHGKVTSAWLYTATDNGGEEAEPATSTHHHTYQAELQFHNGDQARWYLTSLQYTCSDGSWGAYVPNRPVSFLVK